MKITIELPDRTYRNLLKQCDVTSQIYRLLVNGCINPNPAGDHFGPIVEILCDPIEATEMLEFARQFCPGAVGSLNKTLNRARAGALRATLG